jgi:hypothetical protein
MDDSYIPKACTMACTRLRKKKKLVLVYLIIYKEEGLGAGAEELVEYSCGVPQRHVTLLLLLRSLARFSWINDETAVGIIQTRHIYIFIYRKIVRVLGRRTLAFASLCRIQLSETIFLTYLSILTIFISVRVF